MDVQPFTGDADEVLEGVRLVQFTPRSHARAQNSQSGPRQRVDIHTDAHVQRDRNSDDEFGVAFSSKVVSSKGTEPPREVVEG